MSRCQVRWSWLINLKLKGESPMKFLRYLLCQVVTESGGLMVVFWSYYLFPLDVTFSTERLNILKMRKCSIYMYVS